MKKIVLAAIAGLIATSGAFAQMPSAVPTGDHAGKALAHVQKREDRKEVRHEHHEAVKEHRKEERREARKERHEEHREHRREERRDRHEHNHR